MKDRAVSRSISRSYHRFDLLPCSAPVNRPDQRNFPGIGGNSPAGVEIYKTKLSIPIHLLPTRPSFSAVVRAVDPAAQYQSALDIGEKQSPVWRGCYGEGGRQRN